MGKKVFLFTLPLILLIEVIIFNSIVGLLRQSSDMSVFVGVIFICVTLAGNFFLFQFIKKLFKQVKNEK